MVVRALRRDPPAALTDDGHHLRLPVVGFALRRVMHVAAAWDERMRGLQEKERLLPAVAPHFLLVLDVIAAHAEDAPHREARVRPDDRQRRKIPRRDRVFHLHRLTPRGSHAAPDSRPGGYPKRARILARRDHPAPTALRSGVRLPTMTRASPDR